MLAGVEVTAGYDGTDVVRQVSFSVERGTIGVLVGRNGAGKTTLLHVIAGLVPLRSGRVMVGERTFSRWGRSDAERERVVLVPEGRHVFSELSVEENLQMGAWTRRHERAAVRETLADVYTLFPQLATRRGSFAGLLSGGQQQMLAIGRGLMAAPRVLLLDEPSLGLAPLIVKEIFASIRDLAGSGVTIVLAEQNARAALRLGGVGYLVEGGRMSERGPCAELLADADFAQRFLGGTAALGAPDRAVRQKIAQVAARTD